MFSVNDKGQVTFNGKPVDEMTEEEKKQAYGSAGDIGAGLAQSFDFTTGGKPNFQFDPKYYEKYDISSGDAGVIGSGYRLKPEYSRMEGMTQVGVPRSVGGMGEPIDPSLITYDEEFGYITPLTNIKEPRASGLAGFLESYLPYMLAAGMGAAIAATGGFAGLGIAGAGEGTAAGVGEGLAGGASTSGGGVLGSVAGLEPITIPALAEAPTLASIEGIGASATSALGAGASVAPTAGLGGGGLEVSEAMRGILSQGTAAGGSAASAAANAAITQGTQTLAGIGGGSAFGAIGDWFNSLAPGSQRVITAAIGQGVSAISASRRQAEAQQFAREQSDIAYQRRREEEERAAEERRIRGTPQAYTFNITPRTGIIGGGMGG